MTIGRPQARMAVAALALAASTEALRAEPAEAVFMPGLYESESRSADRPERGARTTECFASADAHSFQRDTVARTSALPQFRAVCRLSEARTRPDGFDLAMDCGAARTIVVYHLSEGLVRAVAETRIASRPANSSIVVTLSRRVGACR